MVDIAEDGEFRLTIATPRTRWRAGDPIAIATTLTYLGPRQEIEIWGSGGGVVVFSLDDPDGPLDVGGGSDSDCAPWTLRAGVPLDVPFQKSGGYSADDPNVAFIKGYLGDPALSLPAGRWGIVARATFLVGACELPERTLEASVAFEVVE